MEGRYILGIDAGATKTHYAVWDALEGRAALHEGGCANHEGLAGSYAELEQVLDRELRVLFGALGISAGDISGAGLGIAGVDTERQHDIISAIFSRLGLRRFGLANDAILGVKCECESGAGLCAVNGTGFSVLGTDAGGGVMQIGGFGDWSGDKGGGGYLAARVVACVYRHLFKAGAPTAMTARVLELFGAAGEKDFAERYTASFEGGDRRRLLRELSVILHTCAAQGDGPARAILLECADEYADAMEGVIRRLPDLARDRVEVVLVGSNFTRCECPLAREHIEERLRAAYPGRMISVRPIDTEPVAGALFWGCAEAGMPPERIPRAAIKNALRRDTVQMI